MSGNKEESDTLPQPSWLDAALIQKALRNDGDESAEVVEISVERATSAGDNYASTIYRAKATLADGQERSYIVKGPNVDSAAFGGAMETNMFKREHQMLADVIPQMQAILEEAAPGVFPLMAPRCALYGSGPECLVLEDLGAAGFRMADRKKGLGLRHCLLAAKVTARFHASSHALLRKQPELYALETPWKNWRETSPGTLHFVQGAAQAAADACRAWPGFEQYADAFEKFKIDIIEKLDELNEPRPGHFHVIGHGDFWANNLMFRYEDDSPCDLRVLDLQLSYVTSPVVDLMYFLSGSTSECVHIDHQDLVLREYHHELTKTLTLLGLEGPSLQDLQEELDHFGPLAVFLTLTSVPIAKGEKAADLEGLLQGDNSSLRSPLEQPTVKRWMQRLFPQFHEKGWISA